MKRLIFLIAMIFSVSAFAQGEENEVRQKYWDFLRIYSDRGEIKNFTNTATTDSFFLGQSNGDLTLWMEMDSASAALTDSVDITLELKRDQKKGEWSTDLANTILYTIPHAKINGASAGEDFHLKLSGLDGWTWGKWARIKFDCQNNSDNMNLRVYIGGQ